MIKNYLKTAIRNLLRYKGFATINILSLTLGIVGCLVIGLFVWDENQYDKRIEDAERIFRIYDLQSSDNSSRINAPVPPVYATYIRQNYPEVEITSRMMMIDDKYLVEAGNVKGYESKGVFVDPSLFNLFSLKFIAGDPSTALTAPNAIVLSKELAHRYFGTANAIGKTVLINKDTMEVKGVMADLPSHFHLDFSYVMPIASLGIPDERMESWGWHQFYTYVKLKPNAGVDRLQEKFQAYFEKEIQPTFNNRGTHAIPYFQPLQDIHLLSADFVYDNAIRGNATYVNGLSIIALFVLVIACFNFINLATARSFRRAKEIGVRKVVGADRRQIILQFIGETVLLSLASMLLAVMATCIIVPYLNTFTGKSIAFSPLSNPALGIMVLLAGVLIGVIAGIYPALVLSGFQPIRVLKNLKLTGGGSSWLRPALVVVQFTLSVLLIISTVIVYRQTNFLNNKDLGFNKEQVLYFLVKGDVETKLEAFKNELKQGPGILSVTSGYGLPGDQFAGDEVIIPTNAGDKEFSSSVFLSDYDFAKTLGVQIIAGRDFSRDMGVDEQQAFLINETAVKSFGFGTAANAIGKPMKWNEWLPKDSLHPVKEGRIIGVVQDFHYKSLHEKIAPLVIHIYPQVTNTIAVKLAGNNASNSIAYINKVWNSFTPGYPFDYRFIDQSFGKMYTSEQKLSTLLWIFAVVAIVVGCMGLFGLAAFSAEQRQKEIGIRKVLGATVLNIAALLSKSFVRLVFLSSLIAFPLAWWAMHKWLESFSYRITISWWIFLVAGAAAILVALLTISFQAVKAAVANPVKSLRTE